MSRIYRTQASRDDYLTIFLYIAQDNPVAAARVLTKLDEKLAMLATMPGLGTRRDDLRPGVRMFPVGNYLLLYRVTTDGIELLRAVHGARELSQLFDRSQ